MEWGGGGHNAPHKWWTGWRSRLCPTKNMNHSSCAQELLSCRSCMCTWHDIVLSVWFLISMISSLIGPNLSQSSVYVNNNWQKKNNTNVIMWFLTVCNSLDFTPGGAAVQRVIIRGFKVTAPTPTWDGNISCVTISLQRKQHTERLSGFVWVLDPVDFNFPVNESIKFTADKRCIISLETCSASG